MLFTGPKLLEFQVRKIHTITLQSHALYRDYLKILNFEAKNLSPPTFFELKT